jgi:hypothetical protein
VDLRLWDVVALHISFLRESGRRGVGVATPQAAGRVPSRVGGAGGQGLHALCGRLPALASRILSRIRA